MKICQEQRKQSGGGSNHLLGLWLATKSIGKEQRLLLKATTNQRDFKVLVVLCCLCSIPSGRSCTKSHQYGSFRKALGTFHVLETATVR